MAGRRTRRGTARAASMREADAARAVLLKNMFETLSNYALGCAITVGKLGAVSEEGKPGHLTAAMKVLDFVAAHAGAERDEALENLLSVVKEIRESGDK